MGQLTTVRVADLTPDPDNIRDDAADADIDALAADIAEHGLLQPLVAYPDVETGALKLAAGHRRLHAVRRLGWVDVQVIIRPAPAGDLERLDLMAAENLHRRQLNPIEEAKLFSRYVTLGRTQTEIAAQIGRGISYVSQRLSLLELSEDIQRRVADGRMSVTGAVKAAKWQRIAAGTARADHGTSHQMSQVNVPHFNSAHRLHGAAAHYCRDHLHDAALRIGGACGECWERQIRIDAGLTPAQADPPPTAGVRRPREKFTDPLDILRRLTCIRCGCAATERTARRCHVDRDGRRVLFDTHEFVMEVAHVA